MIVDNQQFGTFDSTDDTFNKKKTLTPVARFKSCKSYETTLLGHIGNYHIQVFQAYEFNLWLI